MQNEKYWRSRIPLWLVLLFLLNVFLIVAVEVLVIYPHPAAPDTSQLADIDPAFENCRILSSDSIGHLNAYLLETSQGEHHLLVLRSHSIFYGRGDAVYAEAVHLPQQGDAAVAVKTGIRTSEVCIDSAGQVTIRYAASQSVRDSTTYYMILGALLEALELALWHLVKRGSS